MFGTTLSHLRSIDLTCCQRTFGLKFPTNLGAAGIPATSKSKFQAAKMRSQWGGSNPLFFIGLVRVKYGLDTTSVRVRKTRGFSTNPGFYLQKYGLVRVNNGLNTTSVRVWVSTLFFPKKNQKTLLLRIHIALLSVEQLDFLIMILRVNISSPKNHP